jgi:bifunctional UDP-N-acetylglucosamine pyrophosphorylase/glucosamine-1-phosphate N-acetyltransferase
MPDPTGLGRIIRNMHNEVIAVVEDKDTDAEQKKIHEINTGIMLVPNEKLKQWLPRIQNHNSQKEYYLTDIIAMAVAENINVTAVAAQSYEEVQGINDREQLAVAERAYQRRAAKQLMLNGVTLKDPARFDLRGELECAQDVTIDINVIIEGKVNIGKNSVIGPNVLLRNVIIGENVIVRANCVIEDAQIANNCIIGPFARVRPGTQLADNVHIGNFVEVKNAIVGDGSKINHLTYVGDATVGQAVNIGAGTITCNYDGVNKHRTVIGDNAFIGSGTELVAPVTVGAGATIGAGSTITCDAPADALTLRRAEQKTIENWQRPKKK